MQRDASHFLHTFQNFIVFNLPTSVSRNITLTTLQSQLSQFGNLSSGFAGVVLHLVSNFSDDSHISILKIHNLGEQKPDYVCIARYPAIKEILNGFLNVLLQTLPNSRTKS